MPILPAEPEIFPDDLWRAESDVAERWWCLHTKPRQEKATARHLHTRRIPYYLPLTVHEQRSPAGRKIRSILPLFPSYVFMKGNDVQRLESFRGNTLVNILEVADQPGLHRDLHQIFRMLASSLPVSFEPTIPVGVRVRIIAGPLAGLTGTVIRRGPRDRFVAAVDFLGCGGSVDLQDWQVEQIAGPG